MKSYKYVLLIMTGLFLLGCDDSKQTIKNLSEQPELQGTFSSECKGVGIEGLASISSKDEMRFMGNQLKVTTKYFSDVNCRKESGIGSLVYDGEFEVERKPVSDTTPEKQVVVNEENNKKNDEDKKVEEGDKPKAEVVKKDDLDAGVIKLKIKDAELKPTDQTLVSLLNGINFCGISDYEKDKSSDVKKEISGTVFCPIKKYPASLVGSYIYNEKSKELTLSEQPTDMADKDSVAGETTENRDSVSVPSLAIIKVFAPTYSKE